MLTSSYPNQHHPSERIGTLHWKLILLALCFFITLQQTDAQISPPGVSSTRGVMWGAVGLNQHISNRWVSNTYVGAARESDPNN